MSETIHEEFDRDRLDALYFEPPYVSYEDEMEQQHADEMGAEADDDGPMCQGHESLDGPIGHVTYCDGSCEW